ncbi:ABC transporter permease subunit [Azospirillum sp. sgz302134]
MLSFAVRRLAAAVPALLAFALIAAAVKGLGNGLGVVLAALPVTVALTLPALALGSGLGALFGLTASLRPRSPAGWAGHLLGWAGPALPAFLLAALFVTAFKDTPAPVAFAAMALALPPAAQAARLARGAFDDALDSGAVLAARARGLDDRAVLWRHAVPMGLAPVAGGLRSAAVATVTGAVAVESLFGLPGTGRLFLDAVRTGDAGASLAALAGLCGLAVLLSALGAVLHGWLDPRLRSA